MRTILFGECSPEALFQLWDPDAQSESELEFFVAKVLSCACPNHRCIVFGGGFRHDSDGLRRPDLALVANDLSHWFVVEVELVQHSFDKHVLSQVRAFRYGEPQPDCAVILARELGLQPKSAETFVRFVPRSVVVIANRRHREWEIALAAHGIQLLAVSVFRSPSGAQAVEIDGSLEVLEESLGFGTYSATDRSLRFPRVVGLPEGNVLINDPGGVLASWRVVRGAEAVWVTKEVGSPDIVHGSFVQLVRAVGGRLSLRRPTR